MTSSINSPQIGIVTNPHSRKNKSRPQHADELRSAVGELGIVHKTESLDAVNTAVQSMQEQQIQYWVADGGDGCLFWVLNKAVQNCGESIDDVNSIIPRVVPGNGGTIDFVARKAGIKGRIFAILERLKTAIQAGKELPVEPLPTLRVELTQKLPDGTEKQTSWLVFSMAIAGFAARYFEQLYRLKNRSAFKITLMFLQSCYASIMKNIGLRWFVPRNWLRDLAELFTPHHCELTLDGKQLPYNEITTLNCSAFSINISGVFKLFPFAKDNKMHVIAGSPTDFEVACNGWRIMRGYPLKSKQLFDGPGEELIVKVTGEESLKPILDGEIFDHVREVKVSLGPTVNVAKV